MNTAPIRVPASLLLDPSLPAPAKLIAVALCQGPASPTTLQERTGLSRPTIRKALALQPASAPPEGRMVSIPPHLLADRRLGARAKLLYGLLQLLPGGQTSYAGLAELAQVSLNTVKKAADELAQTGWLQVSQRNQLSPLSFSLTDPGESEVILARQRIEEAPFRGEALMREYLSLLIDSDDFEDDAAPGFLVNPWTDERMQLDRFYPPKVAFEFNGPQHYHATERFSKAEAARQRGRDYMKLGICLTKGITLVVIHPEDLSLNGMQAKIGQLLPLRGLDGHQPLIAFLETASRRYRSFAKLFP